ncbi:MAG: hypothetical protein QM500_05125 [Methylococcales bacterium]
MNKIQMSDVEKKKIIRSILGENHHAVGNNFPVFSEMMNGLGTFNDALTFAELLPVLNAWISGSVVSSIAANASFAGVLLFPFQQMINLMNANEVGLRAYSYRSISYSITAWAFDKPKPISSPQILSNSRSGIVTSVKGVEEYNKVWRETSLSVIRQIEHVCLQKKINKKRLKVVFKALGQGKPEILSVLILKGFEKDFSNLSKNVWISTYSVSYPR